MLALLPHCRPGTLLQVAIAAKEHAVPVYVAAESYKFARCACQSGIAARRRQAWLLACMPAGRPAPVWEPTRAGRAGWAGRAVLRLSSSPAPTPPERTLMLHSCRPPPLHPSACLQAVPAEPEGPAAGAQAGG